MRTFMTAAEKAQMKNALANIAVGLFLFGPGIIGTALWWYTDEPRWLFGWLFTLIMGLAG